MTTWQIIRAGKEEIDRTVVRLDEMLEQCGLGTSPEKTEVLTIDRDHRVREPELAVRGQTLKNVADRKYLVPKGAVRILIGLVSRLVRCYAWINQPPITTAFQALRSLRARSSNERKTIRKIC